MNEKKPYILFELPLVLQKIIINLKNKDLNHRLDNYEVIDLMINDPKKYNISIQDVEVLKDIIKKIPKIKHKKEIILAGSGKLATEFADELVEEIKDSNKLFFRTDTRDVVEIGVLQEYEESEEEHTGFIILEPHRFITIIESYVIPGSEVKNIEMDDFIFKPKSMNATLSKIVLCSDIFQKKIPNINRIFTTPIPIMCKDQLTFPKKGYDKRFNSWLPYNAPEIQYEDMKIEEAKNIIKDILKEFCFKTNQDFTNSVAGLLTPFLRGLFSEFNVRTPVFFYKANRERAGKDYLAGITGVVYEGEALEEAPISTDEHNKSSSNNNDELRKKILSAFISGRKRVHFSNNRGYINNAVFEGIITATTYSDRVLGKSEILTFDNEMEFSLSGNIGVEYTPDLANRCRFINLFLDIEDANKRKFENPNLHKYIKENRGLILSALYSLVRNWIDNNKPKSSVYFSSFSEWADICGGIMECAGYDSPCLSDNESGLLRGDNETNEMKELYTYCYKRLPDQWINKKQIQEICKEYEIFGYEFRDPSESIKLSLKISKFIGRIQNDIYLLVQDVSVRTARQKYKFTKNIESSKQCTIFDEDDNESGKVGKGGKDITSTTKTISTNTIYRGWGLNPTKPTIPTKNNTKNNQNTENLIKTKENDENTKKTEIYQEQNTNIDLLTIIKENQQKNGKFIGSTAHQDIIDSLLITHKNTSNDVIEQMITSLLVDGVIYEHTPGYYKII